jgi:hypothetical protein
MLKQKLLFSVMNRNKVITKTSYQVAYILEWNIKLFIDGMNVKVCVSSVVHCFQTTKTINIFLNK